MDSWLRDAGLQETGSFARDGFGFIPGFMHAFGDRAMRTTLCFGFFLLVEAEMNERDLSMTEPTPLLERLKRSSFREQSS